MKNQKKSGNSKNQNKNYEIRIKIIRNLDYFKK